MRFRALCFTKPLLQEPARYQQAHSETITTHFVTLNRAIKENDIDVYQTFNSNEYGCISDHEAGYSTRRKFFIVPGGSKDMRRPEMVHTSRIQLFLVFRQLVSMVLLFFVLKGSRMPFHTIIRGSVRKVETPLCNLPRNSVLARPEKNGGADSNNFVLWACKYVQYISDLTANER